MPDLHRPHPPKQRKFDRSIVVKKHKKISHKRLREYAATCSRLKTQQLQNEANILTKFVKNLSDKQMSNIEIVALGKGLKFIPNPNKPKRCTLLTSFKDLKRKMRLRFVMKDKPTRITSKFKEPSKWCPQPTYSRNLEDYLEATITEIAGIAIHNAKNNISKAEVIALNALKNDTSIVIKPFDKGRGIAIMNRNDYQAEIARQLGSHHYERLNHDITAETIALVHGVLHNLFCENEIDKSTFEYLTPNNHKIRTPVMYVLPKIHKAPPANTKFAGRPIISGNGSPTERISEFVDYFLIPIVKEQDTYVKDTNHILHILDSTPLPTGVLLVTLDVVSMYTNTPQEEALIASQEAYAKAPKDKYGINPISVNSLRLLIKLILERNCFEFNNQFYLQKVGCAMGSQASPEICDIVMHKLENSIIPTDSNIIKWLRYRDDILVLYKGTIQELDLLVENINDFHPTLKFTREASFEEVTYLDLKIFKGNKFQSNATLDTKVFTKPTETYQYLDRKSAHPLATFNGFIKGEVLRYARLCSNVNDFIEKRDLFTQKLIARSYKHDEISSAIKGINHEERQSNSALKQQSKTPPLVFKLTYTPHIKTKQLKTALIKHWDKIATHPQLSLLFPEQPIISYKRASNLKDLLVKSRFIPNKNDKPAESDESDDDMYLNALITALDYN